jgi:hypothetical protein
MINGWGGWWLAARNFFKDYAMICMSFSPFFLQTLEDKSK